MYPVHVAIIMDGNGRWAKKRGLPRLAGHKAGVKTLQNIVNLTLESDIKYLTLYAFSSENWSRPKSEINDLMSLLNSFLNREAKEFLENNIRLRVIGRRDRLNKNIIDKISALENKSKSNNGLILIIALDYSGREDIRYAIINIYKNINKNGASIDTISFEDIESNLMTKNLPDPDLIIRTSGEYRISNFLLWQIAYSELYFTDTLWPDFNKIELEKAILDYQSRERRFGKTTAQIQK